MTHHPDHRSNRDRALFKDAILKKYLPVLFNALTKNHILIYLDAFAGPGSYEDGSLGSPLLAIKTFVDFTKKMNSPSRKQELIRRILFRFLERDKRYFDNLSLSINKYMNKVEEIFSNLDVKCYCEDALEALKEGIKELHKIDERNHIAIFVYLDPWGLKGIDKDIVLEFLKLRNVKGFPVELLLRFPPYLVVRFYNNSAMGPEWIETILGLNRHGLEEILSQYEEKEEKWENILKHYLKVMKKIYDSETGGSLYYTAVETLGSGQFYYMIFFTEHPYGLLKMNRAMTQTFAEKDIKLRKRNSPLLVTDCRDSRGNFQFVRKYIPEYGKDHPKYFSVKEEELLNHWGVSTLEQLVSNLTLDRFFAINPDVVKKKLKEIKGTRVGKESGGMTPIYWS